jgi:hypothetical protein
MSTLPVNTQRSSSRNKVWLDILVRSTKSFTSCHKSCESIDVFCYMLHILCDFLERVPRTLSSRRRRWRIVSIVCHCDRNRQASNSRLPLLHCEGILCPFSLGARNKTQARTRAVNGGRRSYIMGSESMSSVLRFHVSKCTLQVRDADCRRHNNGVLIRSYLGQGFWLYKL